ncbi:MAG: hypothetical protein M0018_12310 [Nitrospiraceae bacterium]|nr:hypothetical protein [Nitrospiraceae bacterium]
MTADRPEIEPARSIAGLKPALAAFSAYLLLSIVMTWPMALHFSTGVIGSGSDDQIFIWNYWWIKHAIVDLKTNPFYTDYLFYPHRTGLVLHALIFLNGLFSIPLQYFLPLPAVYNLFTLLAFALSGLGVFLLAGRLVTDRKAAFAAGLIFASFRCVEPYNISMTQWVPFYLFFILMAFDEKESWLASAFLAGLFLIFNFFTDYYAFLAVCIFTAIIIAYYLITRAQKPAELAKRFSPVLLISLPFVLPVTWAAYSEGMSGGGLGKYTLKGIGITLNVADIAGFFSPDSSNPAIGRFSFSHLLTGQENYSYLGVIAVFFSIYALFKTRLDKECKLWAASAAAFLLLAMGPYLHFLGKQMPVPLPYKLFTLSGFLVHFRDPVRLSIYAVLSLSMLAARGMEAVFRKKAFLFSIVLPLILLEYIAIPYGIFECKIPPIYKKIAQDKNARTVLEIPAFIHWGFGYEGYPADYLLYYQSLHEKKLFDGYLSRVPAKTFWSYFNLPVYRSLFVMHSLYANKNSMRLAQAYDKKEAPYFLNLFGVDYVIVHRLPPGELDKNSVKKYLASVLPQERYLNSVLPMDKIYDDTATAVYKTRYVHSSQISIDAATEASILYLYDGWINGLHAGNYGYAIAAGKKSVLLANLDVFADYELDLQLNPNPSLSDKRVEVGINGKKIAVLALRNGWNLYKVGIPRSMVKNGLNKLYFRPFSTVISQTAFKGTWSKFAIGNPYLTSPGYWEQDNSKFGQPEVSFALHKFVITGK